MFLLGQNYNKKSEVGLIYNLKTFDKMFFFKLKKKNEISKICSFGTVVWLIQNNLMQIPHLYINADSDPTFYSCVDPSDPDPQHCF